MARPRIEWSDAQVRLIMSAMEKLDRDFPLDNARFLDGVIDEVRIVTGRLYGATAYSRLLRDVAPEVGVNRRPSSATIQKAIGRAQALAPTSVTQDAQDSAPVDVHALRRALEPVVRDAIAPLHALLASQTHSGESGALGDAAPETAGQRMRLQLAETSLSDAHARLRQLETEMGRLRRELGRAEARAEIAEGNVANMLEGVQRAIAEAGSGADALAATARRLEGTERFLKSQNDAVRQQAAGEADALRAQNRQLRERIDHLILDNDQYRRALTARSGSKGSSE